MYNSERLTLSFLLSADKAGASVANYVEVKGFLKNGNQVTGVRARDRLTEEELDLRARIVLNTTGPWINRVLSLLDGRHKDKMPLSKAINLVTRPIVEEYAVGVPSKDSRLFSLLRGVIIL
jgi:glycerol-3-phosphate dehydrogenase